LPEGAQIVLDDAMGQSSVIAHVGASRMSPNLGRTIALAALIDGNALIGRQVRIISQRGESLAEIVDPLFHKHAGQRHDG
jgi:sarcosine oxidase subunit alpha